MYYRSGLGRIIGGIIRREIRRGGMRTIRRGVRYYRNRRRYGFRRRGRRNPMFQTGYTSGPLGYARQGFWDARGGWRPYMT